MYIILLFNILNVKIPFFILILLYKFKYIENNLYLCFNFTYIYTIKNISIIK